MMYVRWLRGADWPVAAGAFLGLVALVDVVLRVEETNNLVTAIMLGLGATLPLALARTHPVIAVVTLAVAIGLTVVLYENLLGAGLVALALALYLLVRRGVQRARRDAVERDAYRLAVEETLLAHAARGERARIARELHDVVAHHLSMISVQAETARLTTAGMPPDGAKRLLAIGDTARAALTEMRRLLGVLRADAEPVATRAPQPGLQQLLELLDEQRASGGTSARLIVSGPVAALDPGVELTAYRVVQEALTNCRRHAPGAAVDVSLVYEPAALRVAVRDNGPGLDGGAAGHGLVGMRERVDMVGGTLCTGPAPVNGFLVEATLPV